LRKRMLEYMQLKHYSRNTIQSYLNHVAAYARHIGKNPELSVKWLELPGQFWNDVKEIMRLKTISFP